MPSEIRQIIFSNRELLDAIRQYNAQAKNQLPRGQFILCEPVGGDEVGVLVEIEDAMTQESKRVTLPGAYVGAALVSACLRGRIPLPRGGKKSLKIVKDGMALHLTMPATDTGAVEKAPKQTAAKSAKREQVWSAGPAAKG